MNDLNLILLRGLPGSGKTTLARVLSESSKYPIYSVDDYFTDNETNEYVFDYKNNYIAYQECEQSTLKSMKQQTQKIIVHNTFTMDWELEPYFKLASTYGYTLFVVTVENYHKNPNIHNISDDQLQKMAQKYKVKLL